MLIKRRLIFGFEKYMQREGTSIHLLTGPRVQKWRRAFFTFLLALSYSTTLVYIRKSYVEINSVYSFYFCPGIIWTISKIIQEPSDVRKCFSPSRSHNAAHGFHQTGLGERERRTKYSFGKGGVTFNGPELLETYMDKRVKISKSYVIDRLRRQTKTRIIYFTTI